MSKLTEKAAYIKGLADGMSIADKGEQGKVLSAMIGLIEEMAAELEDCSDAVDALGETVDAMSDDVSDLEEVVYELEDEEEEDYTEDDFVEFECPHCGDTIYYDVDLVEAEADLICPSCNKPVIVVSADETEE